MAKVSKRLRFEILKRDDYTCRYCGGKAPDVLLRVDHVVPEALGGESVPGNLVTSCEPCNSGKSSMAPDAAIVDDVQADAMRWAAAMQVAATEAENEIAGEEILDEIFQATWQRWTYAGSKQTVPLPADWRAAIRRFRAAGLTDALITDAVRIAMETKGVKDEFRYFCGMAWRRVTELQEAARAHLGAEPANPDDPWFEFTRDELESHLWRFERQAEGLLQVVPIWLHEEAERRARRDWENARDPSDPGAPLPTRLDMLPDVLRHLGNVLAECDLSPAPREDA